MATVRTGTGDDDRRADLLRDLFGIVVVDRTGGLIQRVEMRLEEATGEVDRVPVGQVAALRESDNPRILLPGSAIARYAPRLAFAPECG